ncbi:oxygen-dependent choline dehydrogenase-like [Brevipalpus obovatus]|uniref:oxygen-dependent choline dehydrogenase-like n=1 Tax=Brevipalpus obovatus TaxID=246614 RepID=UPI003D9FA01B
MYYSSIIVFYFITFSLCEGSISNSSILSVVDDTELRGSSFKDLSDKDLFIQIITEEVSKVPEWGPKVYDLITRLLDVVSSPGYPLKLRDKADLEYDYIIIGAGTAGSVVASRLSEVPENQILLLEAGGEESGFSMTPFVSDLLQKTEHAYLYRNQREKLCAWGHKDNRVAIPAGRGIGGGSGHNGMLYTRGNPLDYNRWEQLGATGWSWPEVFPYFLKLEHIADKGKSPFDKGYYGTDGPLGITGIREPALFSRVMLESAKSLNIPIGDGNGRNQTRIFLGQQTIERGQRCSTGRGYLSSASNRRNLDIVIHAVVHRILIDSKNKRAYGVEYKKNGKFYQVKARKEVILSAGALNSPKLLMLSGIGPKNELEKFGIPVIADLPGVGQNLQDHPKTFLLYTSRPNVSTVYIRTEQIVRMAQMYADNYGGPFGVAGNEVKAFVKSKYALDERPDISLGFIGSLTGSVFSNFINEYIYDYKPEVTKRYFVPNSYKDGFFIYAGNYRATSRGNVRLASKNVEDAPIIHQNYFQNKRDLDVIVEALKMGAKVMESKVAREKLGLKQFRNTLPGCEKYRQGSDEFYRCLAQTITITSYHQVGTCKMGAKEDVMAVVDPQLRVRGIKNLRIIDSSIMPEIVTANTNGPCVMIGEKGADIVRGRKLESLVPPVEKVESALKYINIDTSAV